MLKGIAKIPMWLFVGGVVVICIAMFGSVILAGQVSSDTISDAMPVVDPVVTVGLKLPANNAENYAIVILTGIVVSLLCSALKSRGLLRVLKRLPPNRRVIVPMVLALVAAYVLEKIGFQNGATDLVAIASGPIAVAWHQIVNDQILAPLKKILDLKTS